MAKSVNDTDLELGSGGEQIPLLLTPRNENGDKIGSAIRDGLRLGKLSSHLDPIPHPRLLKLSAPTTPGSSATTPGSTPTTTTSEFPRRWRRSDRRLRRLNTELLEAVEAKDLEEVEKLLNQGASPNATCRLDLVSACHYAALAGSGTLELLMKKGAERHRLDKLGRTPLHLAVLAGNVREVALLLDFPEDVQDRLADEDISSGTEEEVKKLCEKTRKLVNVRCDLGEAVIPLPTEWKDNIDHNCIELKGDSIPLFKPGWTPLHVATAAARPDCTRLLLAAGADPNLADAAGCNPLDVTGLGHYYDMDVSVEDLAEVTNLLLKSGALHNTMKSRGINNVDTPLHVAAELDCSEAIKSLLNAGASISCLNTAGLTPLHVCVEKQLEEPLQVLANLGNNDQDPLAAAVDVKDSEGHTVLQAAVKAGWVSGVCAALEAGADVTLKDNDGETPIHSAAALGDLDILSEILSIAKQKSSLDCQNVQGETPLFKAIENIHIDCIKAILNEGASINITLPDNYNVLHKAAENGNVELLSILITHNKEATKEMINALHYATNTGLAPIHYACKQNHPECVEYLLKNGADVRLRTAAYPFKASTPLHIASVRNFIDVANVILKFDKTTIHEVNNLGWFPIHTAAHHGSRDVIPILLQAGADLSGESDGPKKYKKTAIDLIIHNLSKPTEYLEDLFDSYVTTNYNDLQDEDCVVKLDYSILMPQGCEMQQMKVIQALLETGNRYNQHRLLVHPLLESFLYYKWKALLPFFYTILVCYAYFLMSLTVFVVSVFLYKDRNEVPPPWLQSEIWGNILYSSICLILLQELLFMNIKSKRYFYQIETFVKFSSISLASILPATVFIESWSQADWPRHVATLALLLSWLEMMYLLSRFPNWGYYVLMFGKVAVNVLKILATFVFLVIGFSLSFMVQFHSIPPFDGPLSAIVKTMVMMTSEFDYQAIFDQENTEELSKSITIARLVFVVFLILAAIVLMNLMVGVAVNDINDLEVLGNIKRLGKQVEFLGTLDILVYNKFFSKVLPNKISQGVKAKRNVAQIIEIYPGRPRWRTMKMLPLKLRDAILNKATAQKIQSEKDQQYQYLSKILHEIHDKLVVQEKEKQEKIKTKNNPENDHHQRFKKRHEDLMKHLNILDNGLSEIKDQIRKEEVERQKINDVHAKIDVIATDLQNLKRSFSKLEGRFSRGMPF